MILAHLVSSVNRPTKQPRSPMEQTCDMPLYKLCFIFNLPFLRNLTFIVNAPQSRHVGICLPARHKCKGLNFIKNFLSKNFFTKFCASAPMNCALITPLFHNAVISCLPLHFASRRRKCTYFARNNKKVQATLAPSL